MQIRSGHGDRRQNTEWANPTQPSHVAQVGCHMRAGGSKRRERGGRLAGVAAAAAVLSLGAAGCGQEFDQEFGSESVTPRVSELYTAPNTTMWPSGVVPICWGDASSANHAKAPTVKRFARETWARAANIRFDGWDTCIGSSVGKVRVFIKDTCNMTCSPGCSCSGIGKRADTSTDMWLWAGDTSPFESMVIHEFGHALGFLHEQAREDYDPPCASEPEVPGGNTWGTAPGVGDPDSIMACEDTPPPGGRTDLSPWDIVGVQAAYGRKVAGSIVGPESVCLDIPGGTPHTGETLQTYRCTGGNNQKWKRDQDFHLFGGFTNAYVDVRQDGTDAVQAFTKNVPPTGNQQWEFENLELKAIGGKCVDVPLGSYFNGQRPHLFSCNGQSNQKWGVTPAGQVFAFGSGGFFCLDVQGGATTDGTPVQLWQCHGGNNQAFTFTAKGEIKFGTKCVDVFGGAPNDSAQLQLYTCKADSNPSRFNQRFHLRGPIKNSGSGKCLDIPSGNTNDSVPSKVFSCNGGANQTWDYYFNP